MDFAKSLLRQAEMIILKEQHKLRRELAKETRSNAKRLKTIERELKI